MSESSLLKGNVIPLYSNKAFRIIFQCIRLQFPVELYVLGKGLALPEIEVISDAEGSGSGQSVSESRYLI